MKIALLSTFYPYRGGIAQFGAMLYRALEDQHTVHAYTFTRQYPNFLFPGETQYVTDEDTQVDVIPAERTLDSINPLSYRKTAKKIKQIQPDLVISQYWMTFFGPAIGTVHKSIGKDTKRISIIHNMIPHETRFFDKPANNYFLKHNDGFVVMSDIVQRDLLSLKPDAKLLRIDHPVYNQFGAIRNKQEVRKELAIPQDANVVLFFGFIREYKGLDLLIEAMALLPENTHLLIAGEVYGSFDNYSELIGQSSAKERIHTFNHYIADDEVTNFFSAADVCVLPYKGATQSGITAIAHHFDLPIIATDVGGLKESIHHEKNGLIVAEPDQNQLAEAISRYFSENLKEVYSEAIRKEKAANTWENFAEQIIEFSKTL